MSAVDRYLGRLINKYAELADGEIASYIPELADADPSMFSICIATTGGVVYESGDSGSLFSIQSISKPLTFGLILDQLGDDVVRARIGVEPSGEAFNAIALDPIRGTPDNPMVNAGAITATSMVAGDDRLNSLLENYSRYTDRTLAIDEAVYQSERATGHRNRAIAHLLHESGVIDGDPEAALDLYFQQCSTLVTCRDLAIIAATLANGGRNPITGEVAASLATTRRVLTVMATCGMYDAAGSWLYTVGLPAKSGVSGGILAVLPGRLGIGVFSPLLDSFGNSVRGVQVCRDLTEDLGLQLIQSGGHDPIRDSYTVGERGSKRLRSDAERAVLDERGGEVAVVELQGTLEFAETEIVLNRLIGLPDLVNLVVVDFGRIGHADVVAASFIAEHFREFTSRGGRLIFSGMGSHVAFLDKLVQLTLDDTSGGAELLTFDELDGALEWCEAQLLMTSYLPTVDVDSAELDQHDLLQGLSATDLAAVTAVLVPRDFAAGDLVLRPGDPADELYLITDGQLSVMGTGAGGTPRRLATVSAGMVLGELAFVTGQARDSAVWADSAVRCYVLSSADFVDLARCRPSAETAILRNLVKITSSRASRMRDELAHLTD